MSDLNFKKRRFPIYLSVIIFVSVIILCCVKNKEPSNYVQPDTADNASTAILSKEKTAKEHVFHEGEMRGVWIPYFNLSSGSGNMTEKEFKKHFDNIIKTSKENGINTLFVHVRSHCDAVYPSDIFPFSDIFTVNGSAPDYDPLEYMITAAHTAGLEFHAWINPFRVLSETDKNSLDINSPCYGWIHDNDPQNDRFLIEYDNGLYLNPAAKGARALIINGVRELVENYNIDGVHFDDYFYMFTESDYDREDYLDYVNSLGDLSQPLDLEQWRCTNVNVLISGVYAVIKNADGRILFGISPQANIKNDLESGADVYSWCSRYGYVDYIAPQVYFNSENSILTFEDSVEEWKNIITNDDIKLYTGLALYKAGSTEDDGTWLSSDSIISDQIEYSRKAETDGFILYSWEYLCSDMTAAEVANMKEIIDEA
ncbi:MAG: family 10 glycosylhydrolase [Clostridia bacterium]|nr:family 10 glycosylhydrolase [Clostridia bacterium]